MRHIVFTLFIVMAAIGLCASGPDIKFKTVIGKTETHILTPDIPTASPGKDAHLAYLIVTGADTTLVARFYCVFDSLSQYKIAGIDMSFPDRKPNIVVVTPDRYPNGNKIESAYHSYLKNHPNANYTQLAQETATQLDNLLGCRATAYDINTGYVKCYRRYNLSFIPYRAAQSYVNRLADRINFGVSEIDSLKNEILNGNPLVLEFTTKYLNGQSHEYDE